MDELLKLSIITISYNHGRFLEQTILSVIEQNYSNVEYIIVDGASTDNSLDIIRKYGKYIAYWVSEPDKDLRYALQKGFAHASGDVVAWQNADDYYEPGFFEQVMRVFQDLPDVDLVYGNTNIVNEYSQKIDELRNIPLNFCFDIFGGMPFQNQSAFFRRNLWDKSGGISFQELNFDVDLIFRIAQIAHPLFLHKVIGNYRRHIGSISFVGKRENLQKDKYVIRRRYLGKWSILPKFCFFPLIILSKFRRYLCLVKQGDLDYVFHHVKRILTNTTYTNR